MADLIGRPVVAQRTVTIVQRTIPHYRKPFFELLRARLRSADIKLAVVYSSAQGSDKARADSDAPDWAKRVSIVAAPFPPYPYWQRAFGDALRSDFVIVEQANRPLLNYGVLVAATARLAKVGLWGHGRNFQASPSHAAREAAKRWMTRRANWWFAYTDLSRESFRATGVPENRITVVQNSTDTVRLQATRHCRSGPPEPCGPAENLGNSGRECRPLYRWSVSRETDSIPSGFSGPCSSGHSGF